MNDVTATQIAVAGLVIYWANWLVSDATLFDDAKALARREITAREFIAEGWACQLCRTHWFTAPVAVVAGPVWWAAINGLHVLIARLVPYYGCDLPVFGEDE